jgi:hypothetical protein
MPNGHGGAPFLGSPLICTLLFAAAAFLPPPQARNWVWASVCLALAAMAGWRLAYHMHLRDAHEYGGAYTPNDAYRRAAKRYRVAAVIYTIVAAAAGFGVLWWRGLP